METKSSEPIRLSEGQTELLTKALLEAAEQAAVPKAGDTQFLAKPLAKPAMSESSRAAKKPMVI